jgi:hypothetical protein
MIAKLLTYSIAGAATLLAACLREPVTENRQLSGDTAPAAQGTNTATDVGGVEDKAKDADLAANTRAATSTVTRADGNYNPEHWLSDFRLGTRLGPHGGIVAGTEQKTFELGQTIYVAMRLRNPPASAAVRVLWRGPGKEMLGEETKRLRPGQDYLHFAADGENLPPGNGYGVEIWADNKQVARLSFDLI